MRDLITKEEIQQVFARKIKPRIAGLELERSETIKKLWTYCGSTLIVCIVVTYSFFTKHLDFAFAASAILQLLLFKMITANFITKYKKEVIKEIFNALIPGCTYQPERAITRRDFDHSRLIDQSYNVYEGEDFVKGQIGDMGIEFSEVKAIKETRTKNGKSRHTLYQGLFFVFTLPKDLRQDTLILADTAEKTLGRNVGRFLQKNTARSGYELVQVESVEFEKHYVVYSSDQIKSRVLLKPIVLDNLTDFKNQNKQLVDISIRGKMLFLCIKTDKNHFEPKLWGELVSFKDIREIYDLVMLVRDLHEDLELDQAS